MLPAAPAARQLHVVVYDSMSAAGWSHSPSCGLLIGQRGHGSLLLQAEFGSYPNRKCSPYTGKVRCGGGGTRVRVRRVRWDMRMRGTSAQI